MAPGRARRPRQPGHPQPAWARLAAPTCSPVTRGIRNVRREGAACCGPHRCCPVPAPQKGQRAREAPRRRVARAVASRSCPETPLRGVPLPDAHSPTRESAASAASLLPSENCEIAAPAKRAGRLPGPAVISKKPLGAGCPAGLGHPHARTRPGAGGLPAPPRPHRAGPVPPRPAHAFHRQQGHGPRTDGLRVLAAL